MNPTVIYVDGSFDWKRTLHEPIAEGKIGICFKEDKETIVEGHSFTKVEGLKQYINLFELLAIIRALEMFEERKMSGDIFLFSDSLTAVSWCKRMRIGRINATVHHHELMERYKNIKSKLLNINGTRVTIVQCNRLNNVAGFVFM